MATFLADAHDLGTDVVDIFVGPNRKRFVVHRRLLASQSSYFKKALDELPQDAETSSLIFKAEDPVVFTLLVGWLYRGIIPGLAEIEKKSPASSFKEQTAATASLTAKAFDTAKIPSTPFMPLIEKEPGSTWQSNLFLHIGFQAHYAKFSPEEVRLSDYRAGRRYTALFSFVPCTSHTAGSFMKDESRPPVKPSTFASILDTPGRAPITANPFAWLIPFESKAESGVSLSNLRSASQSSSTESKVGQEPIMTPATSNSLSTMSSSSQASQTLSISNNHVSDASVPKFGFEVALRPSPASRWKDNVWTWKDHLRSNPSTERYQLQSALLHLCLLGERLDWPALFNIAVDSYIRVISCFWIPAEHVDLIYQRSKVSSSLRQFVMDKMNKQAGGHGHLVYTELAIKYPDLLRDIFRRVEVSAAPPLFGTTKPKTALNPSVTTYHMREGGQPPMSHISGRLLDEDGTALY